MGIENDIQGQLEWWAIMDPEPEPDSRQDIANTLLRKFDEATALLSAFSPEALTRLQHSRSMYSSVVAVLQQFSANSLTRDDATAQIHALKQAAQTYLQKNYLSQ